MKFLFPILIFFLCCDIKKQNYNNITNSNSVADKFIIEGRAALKKHYFFQALAYADSADKYSIEKSNVYFFKGRIYSELGQFNEAEKSYKKVLNVSPNYRGVWNNLGNNSFRQQQFKQAIDYYHKEIINNIAPIPLRAMGRAFVELGETDSAKIYFQNAIKMDPGYAAAYFNLAQLEEDEGNLINALQHSKKAFDLDNNNLEYQYVFSSLLVQMGQSNEAIDNLKIIVEKWPWHHSAHYNLGRALIHGGQNALGESYLEKAESLRAKQAKIDHLENTVRAVPDDPLSYAVLAFNYRMVGRYNDAMHSYKVALYLDSENFDIWNNVANLYLLQGDTTGCLATYNYILTKNPSLTNIWINMGVVYALSNKKSKARNAWEQILKYEPDNIAVINYLKKLENN
tara:strand:- start:3197 stop:4393 length:1197 start_codon:yes stop_codon:yes gene_type:complete